MVTWILAAALAIGGKPVHHKPTKPDTESKTVWVCKGNSYMVLKKGFKPQNLRGCHKTKMPVESDKP